MTQFDSDGMFFQCEHVVSCELETGVALLDLQVSEYYQLNSTAALVWEAMSEPSNLDSIVGVITAKFDVDTDSCRTDVISILKQFTGAGMVEHSYALAS